MGEGSLTDFEKPLRNVTAHLSKHPRFKNLFGATENMLFSTIREQLICIDDLERAGSGLDVMDVFGLISLLKEQRKCKIILLLNDEEILPEQKVVFGKQFEKVVDSHLRFDPDPVESADIVFPSPSGIKKDMHDYCIVLGIKNIRIIKQVERICGRLEDILSPKYPDLIRQAAHSATLFACSKLQSDSHIPPFDFVVDFGRLHGIFAGDEMPENERSWRELMAEYRFSSVDDFDHAIHKVVENGIFDTDAILRAAKKQSQGIAKSKQEQVIHDT